MKTLLHCSTHLDDSVQVKTLRAWLRLANELNRGKVDVMLVDSPGKIDVREVALPGYWRDIRLNHEDEIPVLNGINQHMVRFRDAIGHPVHDNLECRSGPDRAWMRAIEIAIASGYDRVVYIESDILCLRPVSWAFDQMHKPVGTGGPIPGQSFDEVALFFADVEYLWRTNFVGKFDWKGPTKPEGESRMMQILDDDRQVLPLRGNRDEMRTGPDELATAYPAGLDYLTHARPETLQAFLRMNGMEHVWP